MQVTRQILRKKYRHKRRSLDESFQEDSSYQLVENIKRLSRLKTINNIAVYLANDGELNLSPLINWCWESHINTYLPVIHPFCSGHLLFLQYHESSVMQKNCYDILEPRLDVRKVLPVSSLDIILTPLVAFDDTGARLGMGGGYYDRTLATWYKSKNTLNKPYPIGIAHDCQKADNIPIGYWDIPIPEVITPTKHYQFFD